MNVFMQTQEVWDVMEPKIPQNTVSAKKDKIALAAIYHGISEHLLLSIAEKQTTKEAWET